MARKRIGAWTMREVAKKLCKVITDWGATIKVVFPDATNLHTAIDGAMLACSALVDELNEVIEQGV